MLGLRLGCGRGRAPGYPAGAGNRTALPHRDNGHVTLFNIRMSEERDIQQRLDQLRAVPGRIAAATDSVSDPVLHRRTAAEPWSVNDVLAHLLSLIHI